MNNIYIVRNSYNIRVIAERYDIEPVRLLECVIFYMQNRHEECFTLKLQDLVGRIEPFVKNELKPYLMEICRAYDACPFKQCRILEGRIIVHNGVY